MTFIIGHRGARNEAPENTLQSFMLAQNNGCLAFEIDVRLSKDNELMVFHDQTLGRMTGVYDRFRNWSSDELRTLDARGKVLWPHRCEIPKLAKLLLAADKTLDWQLEIKPDSPFRLTMLAHRLAALLASLTNSLVVDSQPRITVTSSSTYLLRFLQSHYPHIRTGLVSDHAPDTVVQRALNLDCELIALKDHLVSEELLKRANNANLEVSVWTVNDINRMHQLTRLGVSSIITDIPTRALQELRPAYPSF